MSCCDAGGAVGGFLSMLNPMVSMVIAVAALIALGTYHFIKIISLKIPPVVAAIITFQHS